MLDMSEMIILSLSFSPSRTSIVFTEERPNFTTTRSASLPSSTILNTEPDTESVEFAGTLAGRPTVNTTKVRVAQRLRIMASSLAQALDGLNNNRKFPIQPEIQLERLFMPDGRTLDQADPTPTSLQEVLLRLAGTTPRARSQ